MTPALTTATQSRPLGPAELAIYNLMRIQGRLKLELDQETLDGLNVVYMTQGNFTIALATNVVSWLDKGSPRAMVRQAFGLDPEIRTSVFYLMGVAKRDPNDPDNAEGARALAFERALENADDLCGSGV